MDYETLKVAIGEDRVGIITMNRPEVRNAMNTQMMTDLRDLFTGFYVDPDVAACLVLTGAQGAFCSGGDLRERKGMTDATWRRQHAIVEQMVRAMHDCPIPIIAAVNGPAYAGGMEVALASDFVYAAQSARFALTEVTLGILPGACGTQNLPRAVGVRRAKELILTGRVIGAADAERFGLANRVAADVEAATAELVDELLGCAPVAVGLAKRLIDASARPALSTTLELEVAAQELCAKTEDVKEGVRAAAERRAPNFQGR